MRKLCVVLLSAGALMVTGAASAQVPAPQSPIGGTGAHGHSVVTGTGCQNVGTPLFEPTDRGLHQGANASGAHGPRHGRCP